MSAISVIFSCDEMAKCGACGKDFEAGIKAAFKLGLQHGLSKSERRLRAVYDELVHLDKYCPSDDTIEQVRVPLHYYLRLIIVLKKSGNPYHVSQLRKLMREQLGQYPYLVDIIDV
jgi:hypothetical protein